MEGYTKEVEDQQRKEICKRRNIYTAKEKKKGSARKSCVAALINMQQKIVGRFSDRINSTCEVETNYRSWEISNI